jgi:hypothetical protein
MSEVILKAWTVLGAVDLLVLWLVSKTFKPGIASTTTSPEESESPLSMIVVILSVVSGFAGLIFRFYGLDRSLWLDEFGTLWTVEGNISQLVERVNTFQGQSVAYYFLVWLFVHLLGESEFTLRLLSLLLAVGTVVGIYVLGNFLYGKNVALLSASLFWLSPWAVRSSVDARPYALALFLAVIMLYGFARAVRQGDRVGRWLFIAGGATLFSTHYVLILVAAGIPLGYFLFPCLRSQYSVRRFTLDVGIQVLLVWWCFPQIFALWNRRTTLLWLGSTNYLAFLELIVPFAVLIIASCICGRRFVGSNFQKGLTWVLGLGIGAQVGVLHLLAYFGINLLHARYMIVVLVPAALLASRALLTLPRYVAPVPFVYSLLFFGTSFLIDFRVHGSFSGVGFQNWQNAVTCLDKFVRREPQTLVLYRSGFVEEDGLINGPITPAALSPLRSPGRQEVSWKLIELPYSWDKPGRENYFTRVVEPAIRSTSVFYFLTCAGCFNRMTGQYAEALPAWVEEKFPGNFHRESVEAGRGIMLMRFVDQLAVPVAESKKTAVPSLRSIRSAGGPSASRECP